MVPLIIYATTFTVVQQRVVPDPGGSRFVPGREGDSAMTLEWQVSQPEAGGGGGHAQRRVDGAHDHAWRRTDGDPYAVLLVYECGICHIEWAM